MVSLGNYSFAKCTVLMAYYCLLNHAGLGHTFKFVTFQVLTPIAKFFHFNRLRTRKDRLDFSFSIINDFCMSSLFYVVYIPKFVGKWYGLFPIANVIVVILIELIQQRLLDKEKPYIILLSFNVSDQLLAVIVSFSFYFVGAHIDFDRPVDNWSFPVFLGLILWFDAVFGLIHYYAHTIPWMAKKHMIHHQYKGDNLCAIANIHAEILDSFVMNVGIFAAIMVVYFLGYQYIPLMDMMFAAGLTHVRFAKKQMNLMYFFEFDLIDMILGKDDERMYAFHHKHHNEHNKNFSVFGTVSDEVFRTLHKRNRMH